jgi:hypothetical protein
VADLAAIKSTPPGDPGFMATALAAVVRSSRPTRVAPRPRRAMRRLVGVAASAALLMAMSGIAMAADDAAPGDLLYGVDRAFELIGIGDGGLEERIAEFDVLVARGERDAAFQLLEEFIESAGNAEAATAQVHLEAATPTSASKPDVADDNVEDLHEFIEENKGKGVGVDGRDFGQDVADIVSNREKDLPDQAEGNKPESPSDNGNPDPGPPDHAEPKTDPPALSNSIANQDPGPLDDAGNSGNNGNNADGNGNNANPEPGPPDKAAKKDK